MKKFQTCLYNLKKMRGLMFDSGTDETRCHASKQTELNIKKYTESLRFSVL